MKIIHTADWHIGKVLHKHPLADEINLFFEWLFKLIESEKVDLLLVSGDIFDLANPSAKDRQLYYGFLRKLVGKNLKIIITGGNHDSIGFLEAPKELLSELNINIVGGAINNIEEELIEVKDKNGKLELIVAAVPFLRDKDLRNSETDELYKNRTEAIREGIKTHYHTLGQICADKYPDIPAIAMGHLFAVGSEISDSERDIHIGNAAAIESSAFPKSFQYIALGHIHRPQIIGGSPYIRYSGSPIALSFSEKEDQKKIILLEINGLKLTAPKVIDVPKSRELKKFSGNLMEISAKLEKYKPDYPLVSFVELEIKEDSFSSKMLMDVEDLKANFSEGTAFKILKSKTTFKSGTKDTADLFKTGESIEDLSPKDVFEKRLDLENLEDELKESMKAAFQELLEAVQQNEQ